MFRNIKLCKIWRSDKSFYLKIPCKERTEISCTSFLQFSYQLFSGQMNFERMGCDWHEVLPGIAIAATALGAPMMSVQVDHCKASCIENVECVSFIYSSNDVTCTLFGKNSFSAELFLSDVYDYYEINCDPGILVNTY